MFIAIIQAIDVLTIGTAGAFLLFFIASWASYMYRIARSTDYEGVKKDRAPKSVSIIVPVVDEPPAIWSNVLDNLEHAIKKIEAQVFIVCNGSKSAANGEAAEQRGFTVLWQKEASKRQAIAKAAEKAVNEITVILDSDTMMDRVALHEILKDFENYNIGGVTPRHEVFLRNKNFWRRASDWMEDIRFTNSLPGLSALGKVNCLPGRMFAIRTDLLKTFIPRFINQSILGVKIETGDDRVLTQYLLESGYSTIYDASVVVRTNAPDTLKQFAKQRLRWARSSFREGFGSLRNFKSPATLRAISWYSIIDAILRWWFFGILVAFAVKIAIGSGDPHFFNISIWQYIIFGMIGFIVNGYLRQLPHLIRHPEDIPMLPAFIFMNLFILTPVEWYGNLTFLKQGWMTRNTK